MATIQAIAMIMFNYPYNIRHHFVIGGIVSDFENQIQGYEEYITRHFESIREWILPTAKSILDIGCGLGGIDIMVYRYLSMIDEINLMDGDGTNDRQMSYSDNTKAWSDRLIAEQFVLDNVKCVVNNCPCDPDLIVPVDLILSLKSCGHHYPVSMYINLIRKSIRHGGRVILDIRRRRPEGIQTMIDAGFRVIGKCQETPKCERMIFEIGSSL